MNASEWREVPGYGQRGVDILADLEAAETARDKWEVQAERNRDVADKQYARAEKAEADFDSEREACAAAVRQWNKAEAERDRYDMALQSLTPGGSEFVHDPERCVETVRALRRGEHEAAVKYAVRVKELEAECAALKAELADLRPFFDTVEGMWPWIVAEGALVSITARIRARREKEAVK
jgi:DNA repair exonuclease SbcCD ATPase subunit